MKLVPTGAYEEFNKDWFAEVDAHNELANQHQPHFVRIFDAGTEDVTFCDDTVVKCHWALMDYVPGPTLDVFMKTRGRDVFAVAQIAIDLLEMLRVLAAKRKVHNDLHAGNVIVTDLGGGDRRAGAIDESIRAVAIDFGSLADGAIDGRPTDLQRVGEILQDFTSQLLIGDPAEIDSRSYRLASELTRLRDMFGPELNAVRVPNYEELKESIRTAVRLAWGAEWESGGNLSTVAEGYNAQTLKPAAVAKLLFDDQKWTAEIAGGGAQIVLGMRGCGKTMLLRSLDFHARVALGSMNGDPDPLTKVAKDGFVGIYVSAVRLLDARRNPKIDFRPILFAAFAREAVRVVMHLETLRSEIDPQAAKGIADVVRTYLTDLELPVVPSASSLEQALQQLLFSLASGEAKHPLKTAASTAFIDLARQVIGIAARWGTPRVLYLLDDVSTRYLDDALIRSVLSEVLFQNDVCAFKVTTETQTWVSVLRSPGGIEALRADRDYRLFNLGERVTQRLGNEGWRFVDNLLDRRLQATTRLAPLQGIRPWQILGRRTLEDIASTIAATDASAAERQSVYSGIDALAAMCVGDIGDTITLFDRMVEHVNGNVVGAKQQTAAYRQLCGQRLWELASKNVTLKDHALGFAEASSELLRSSQVKKDGGKSRLRQYTKLYVRDIDEEAFESIRRLIDAGVFALEGGIPRTKSRDADPITHFVLVFRKVLGVSSWIGLSDRDRFELSGEPMREWLRKPATSKNILIRNQDTNHLTGEQEAADAESRDVAGPVLTQKGRHGSPAVGDALQPTFFAAHVAGHEEKGLSHAVFPLLKAESVDALPQEFDIVCCGLGFEPRARISAERIVKATRAARLLAVRYPEGDGDRGIERIFDPWDAEVKYISLPSEVGLSRDSGNVLIDVTGMRTTFVWAMTRAALRERRQVWIAYTRAAQYWPSAEDVERVLGEGPEDVPADSRQLSRLRELVSGEQGSYDLVSLVAARDDIMRPLCLIAVASPKMQRLEHLVEARAFDRLEIIASSGEGPRARLSRAAGNAASVDIASGPLRLAATTDLLGNVRLLEDLYQSTFIEGAMDVAVGLTGSKIQSVAMAALSAAVKVAEAWYVQPSQYDQDRFTQGAGTTTFFRLSLP